MDTFPTEILAKVLSECLPELDEPYPPVSTSVPPLLFTTINRRWRAVACNNPDLWRRIHVNLQVTAKLCGLKPTVEWTEMQLKGEAILRWLKMSNGRNLSLSFKLFNHDLASVSFVLRNRVFDDLMLPILDSICAYSKQWKRLDLHQVAEPYRSRFLNIPAEDLPRLTHLTFQGYASRIYPLSSLKNSKLLKDSGAIRAPLLSSLSLTELSPADRLQDLPLSDWTNIQELDFTSGYNSNRGYLDMADAEILLRRCRALVSLKLTIQEGGPLTNPSQEIVLPRLKSFYLLESCRDSQGRPFLTPFLSLLRLPVLTQLTTTAAVQPALSQEASLMTLIKANESTFGQTLTEIEFEYNYLNQNELKETLKQLPAVTRLSMTASSMYPYREMESIFFHPPHFAVFWSLRELIPELVDPENEKLGISCLLPQLEHFHFSLAREEEFKDDELTDFLEKRLKYAGLVHGGIGGPISQLKYVYGGFVSEKNVDVHEELLKRGVNLDGIKIEVEYELECQCTSI